jgi:glycosyltransferase involved in cell wall biosynthesis
MKLPEKIRIIFRPNDDLRRYEGFGINTELGNSWEVEREVGKQIISWFPDNWRPDLDYASDESLVTAVMPTVEGRERFARFAIEQLLDQTWKVKDMVIVNSGSSWVAGDGVPGVLEIHATPSRLNPGLRNIGDKLAEGHYIIRWDDDDVHSPERIAMQMKAILESGYPASTLSRYTVYHAGRDIAFEVDMGMCPGLMLYKNEGKKYFTDMQTASDSAFYASHYQGLCITVDNLPSDYLRVYHGENLRTAHFIMGLYNGNKTDLVEDRKSVG